MKERNKCYWLVNVNDCDMGHVHRVFRNP